MALGARKKRRRLSADQARIAALDAAEALFMDGGFQAVKMKEVAAKAGVAPSNLSHHFGSIDDLRFALTERMFERLFNDVLAVMENASIYYSHGPDAVGRVFDLFAGKSMAQLIAWLVLNDRVDDILHLSTNIENVRKAIQERFWLFRLTESQKQLLAERAIYLVIVIAVGEGVVGEIVGKLLGVPAGAISSQQAALDLLRALPPAPQDWALPPISGK